VPILCMIVGIVSGISAVVIGLIFAAPGPILFAAYVGGGAVGIILSAAVILGLRMVQRKPEVASLTAWGKSDMPDIADTSLGTPDVASVVYLPKYRVAAERALFRRNQPERKRLAGRYGWPERTPEDLRLALLDLLSYDRVAPEDIWDEIQDWLERNEVHCPTGIRMAQEGR